jgi:hypothetical protein|eukprot:jgi/Chrpa1/6728/Chrysochromulina_OHIO_Genome00018346-RA
MLASEELDCDDFWRRPTFEAEFRVRTLAVTHNPKAVHVDWMFEAYLVHLRCIRLQGIGEQEQVTHMCQTDVGSEARRATSMRNLSVAIGVLRRKRPFSQRLFTVEVQSRPL